MQHNDSFSDLLPSGTKYNLSTKLNSDILPVRKDKTRKTPDVEEIKPITTTNRSESSFGISLKVANYPSRNSTPTIGNSRIPRFKDASKRPNTAPIQQLSSLQKRVSFSEAAEADRKQSAKTLKPKTPPLTPGFIDYKRFVKPYAYLDKSTSVSSNVNVSQNQLAHTPATSTPALISSGKMKALSVEMEIHMLENIERLKGVEENEHVLRNRFHQIYSDTFEEIIKVCPFGKILRMIKDAYEKDVLIANNIDEKKHYDELVILYTNAQNNLNKLDRDYKQMLKENNQLKNELKRQKSDSQRYKSEIERLTQLQSEITSSVKPELRNLLTKKEKIPSQTRTSLNNMSGKRLNTSPRSFRNDSAKSRLFNQSDMEAASKDLRDRDRLFELESELTKTILKERELTREISLINLEREKDEKPEKKEEKSEDIEDNLSPSSRQGSIQRTSSRKSVLSDGEDQEDDIIDEEDETKTESLREKLLRNARQQRMQDNVALDLDYTDPNIVKKINHGVPPPVISTKATNMMFRCDSQDSLSLDGE